MEWLARSARFSEYAWSRVICFDISVGTAIYLLDEKPMPNESLAPFANQRYLKLDVHFVNPVPISFGPDNR